MIRAHGLTKVYGEFAAVDGIDFHVTQGESFGILGPNGAGKSTTMRMLGATLQRTSGELSILGHDPTHDGPTIRAHLGVVPQQDNLDTELTVSPLPVSLAGLPGEGPGVGGRRTPGVCALSETSAGASSIRI